MTEDKMRQFNDTVPRYKVTVYPVQCSVSDVMVLWSTTTQNVNSRESSSMCCVAVRVKISG